VKPQNIFRNCLALPLLVAAVMTSVDAYADMVVIVSAKSHVTNLTPEQTARIFLGKVNRFPDGGDALPIDQTEGNPVRDEFYEKVVHKNPSQLTAYWAKIIFTGNGRPPVELESSLAVRKAVETNPNAIGYIDKRDVNKRVRVILEP